MAARSGERIRQHPVRGRLVIADSANTTVRSDLERCEELAHSHYENFAVGSWLLPRSARGALAAIYAVVRIADDMADEEETGTAPAERARAIREWEKALLDAVNGGDAPHWALRACAEEIRRHDLDVRCFQSLFRAFARDTEQVRYANFEDLLGYCRDSANPVGRLVIQLLDPTVARDPLALEASDAICTGLQLLNHWQDVAEDAQRGRIYLPEEERSRFGVDENTLLAGHDSAELRSLLSFEVARARALLESGGGLVARSRGRLRLESALFRRAGLVGCDVLSEAGFAVMGGAPRIPRRRRLWGVGHGILDALSSRRSRLRSTLPLPTARPGASESP